MLTEYRHMSSPGAAYTEDNKGDVMEELKRFFAMLWQVTLSSLLSLLVYLPLAAILRAAENDRIEDGSIFWAPIIVYIIYEIVFLVILWYVRFHHNDSLEKAFMKEYCDKVWTGKKADLPMMLKNEALAYVFAFAVILISAGIGMLGRTNPFLFLYSPLTVLQSAVHPLIAAMISFALFAAGYTWIALAVREKLATIRKRDTRKTWQKI